MRSGRSECWAGYATLDAGPFKRLPITERLTVPLGFEAFCTLNRVNLHAPATAQNSVNSSADDVGV
jgi:hypothetical protein